MQKLLSASVLALMCFGNQSFAQGDREQTWEIGLSVLDLSGVDRSGPNGSSISVDSSTGFGFSGAYNFTPRLALGLDLNYASPNYRAVLVPDGPGQPESIRNELGVDTIQFKGIFNLLDSDFTPFFEVGLGWTYLDSNIVSGISDGFCWWDPWWGYTCPIYYETYSDTRTSYSYAVGIRWDINSDFVFRAGWGLLDIDTSRGTEDVEVDSLQLTFGWRF